MLETQIAHQASSSSTPPGRLPSKPEQNPREQCNAIVLRSGTRLEGPKGTSVGMESEKEKNKGLTSLGHESELEKKREVEKEKETKSLPLSLTCPLSPFHKDLLALSLNLNLASFLIC